MPSKAFVEALFWMLVAASAVWPLMLFAELARKRLVSVATAGWFGLSLVALAAVAVYLMANPTVCAKLTAMASDSMAFDVLLLGALFLLVSLLGAVASALGAQYLERRLAA